jgi:hypothetical protein
MLNSTRFDSTSDRRSLFIIGAPRTGTTSFAKALAAHPWICFSKPKETHFFMRLPAEGVSVQEIRRRYETAYFRTLGPQHRVIAEGSVSYLYGPSAIRRILEFDPQAILVVGLRNPLELLPSYHARLLYTMDENIADFEHAWRMQERRSRGEAIPRRCREPRLLQYAEVGRLGHQLRRLIEIAGRERCFLILFEDFRGDPLRTYRDLLAFARLPDDGRTEVPHKNENRSYRRGWLQPLVMNPPASVARLAGSVSETGHTRLRSLVRPLRRRLKKANSERTTRPALPPGLREELAEFFRDDVAELGELLRRDLSHWLDRDS